MTYEADLQDSVPSPSVSVAESDTSESKQYVFKDPNFVVSNDAVSHRHTHLGTIYGKYNASKHYSTVNMLNDKLML